MGGEAAILRRKGYDSFYFDCLNYEYLWFPSVNRIANVTRSQGGMRIIIRFKISNSTPWYVVHVLRSVGRVVGPLLTNGNAARICVYQCTLNFGNFRSWFRAASNNWRQIYCGRNLTYGIKYYRVFGICTCFITFFILMRAVDEGRDIINFVGGVRRALVRKGTNSRGDTGCGVVVMWWN